MATLDSALLRKRLADAGFAPQLFRYHSTKSSLDEITAALAAQMRATGPQVHVIGHSLGGVIAFETFDRHADLPPGRVVLMGAPLRGARAAQSLARHAFGQAVLGPLAVSQLAQPRERRWTIARELGLIAGSRSIGVGRFMARLSSPNDGTVCVDETRLPGALAETAFHTSHLGMLLHPDVAHATVQFLRSGSFESR